MTRHLLTTLPWASSTWLGRIGAVLTRPAWLAGITLTVLAVGAAGFWVRGRVARWRHTRWTDGARWVTIAAPPEVEPTAAAAFWTTLSGLLTPARRQRLLYGTAHVAWEYVWSGRQLSIRVWVPGTIPPGAVEAAVTAAWPGATTTTDPAQAPIPLPDTGQPNAEPNSKPSHKVDIVQAGGALWLQDAEIVPLRTDHDTDPLRALLAAGATLRHREYACLQVLGRPAAPRRVRAARAATRRALTNAATAPTGGSAALSPWASGVATGMVSSLVRCLVEPLVWLVEAFLPGRPTTSSHPRGTRTAGGGQRDVLAEAQRRPMVDKTMAIPHFEIAIRYAVATQTGTTSGTGSGNAGTARDGDKERRRHVGRRLDGLAHTLASAAAAYTRPNRLRRMRMPHPVQVLAGRRFHRGFLATVEELAALAALPQDLAVPGLDRARARAMPAPVAIPSGGRQVKVLGRAQIGGHAVGLQVADARQHVHLVGKTGVGKSTLLLNMILADVHAHRGAVVIDPRGDLITDILDRLPLEYADRIHLIDPDQPHPACFNPLDTTSSTRSSTRSSRSATGHDAQLDAHLAVDNLVGVFAKIFQRHWGPRIDDTLRVSCLTLMRHSTPTLALVPPLLNDRTVRARFTVGLTDPEGLGGFWQWYDSMNDGLRAQVIGPVLARLRAFLLRDFVKNVIGTHHSSFRMSDVLDGGLLLCRLPKGQLGEDTARILGSLIVARTWQAALARATIPETQRRDCTLYVDECQNFLTLPGSVDDMLAEARGFRLGLVLAHQNLAQLPRETQAAVSANARSKIYFTVEPGDARELAKHTTPELSDHDLAHLDVHTAAARLLVAGRELPAFTFTTNPPPAPLGQAAQIREACAQRNKALTPPPLPGDTDPSATATSTSTPAPTPASSSTSNRDQRRRPGPGRHPRPGDDDKPMRA